MAEHYPSAEQVNVDYDDAGAASVAKKAGKRRLNRVVLLGAKLLAAWVVLSDSNVDILGDFDKPVPRGEVLADARRQKASIFETSSPLRQFQLEYTQGAVVESKIESGGNGFLGLNIGYKPTETFVFGSDCLAGSVYDPDSGAGVLRYGDIPDLLQVVPFNPTMPTLWLRYMPGEAPFLMPMDYEAENILTSYGCDPDFYGFGGEIQGNNGILPNTPHDNVFAEPILS